MMMILVYWQEVGGPSSCVSVCGNTKRTKRCRSSMAVNVYIPVGSVRNSIHEITSQPIGLVAVQGRTSPGMHSTQCHRRPRYVLRQS